MKKTKNMKRSKNMKGMKKGFFRAAIAALMAALMFSSSFITAAAMAVSAPDNDEPVWTIGYEDGVFSFRVDPDAIYQMVKDKTLTKAELERLIPSDIAALIENKDNLDAKAIADVLTNYIGADDIKAMVYDLPVDILRSFIDKELVEAILSVDDIINIIDVAGLISSVDQSHVTKLLENVPMDILLNDAVKAKLQEIDFGKIEIDFDEIDINKAIEAVGGYTGLIDIYKEEGTLSSIISEIMKNSESMNLILESVPKEKLFPASVCNLLIKNIGIDGILDILGMDYGDLIEIYEEEQKEQAALGKTGPLDKIINALTTGEKSEENIKTILNGVTDVKLLLPDSLLKQLDISKVISAIGGYEALLACYESEEDINKVVNEITKDSGNIQKIFESIPADKKSFIFTDAVCKAVAEKIGVSGIVDKLGGYDVLLDCYEGAGENETGINDIIKEITKDESNIKIILNVVDNETLLTDTVKEELFGMFSADEIMNMFAEKDKDGNIIKSGDQVLLGIYTDEGELGNIAQLIAKYYDMESLFEGVPKNDLLIDEIKTELRKKISVEEVDLKLKANGESLATVYGDDGLNAILSEIDESNIKSIFKNVAKKDENRADDEKVLFKQKIVQKLYEKGVTDPTVEGIEAAGIKFEELLGWYDESGEIEAIIADVDSDVLYLAFDGIDPSILLPAGSDIEEKILGLFSIKNIADKFEHGYSDLLEIYNDADKLSSILGLINTDKMAKALGSVPSKDLLTDGVEEYAAKVISLDEITGKFGGAEKFFNKFYSDDAEKRELIDTVITDASTDKDASDALNTIFGKIDMSLFTNNKKVLSKISDSFSVSNVADEFENGYSELLGKYSPKEKKDIISAVPVDTLNGIVGGINDVGALINDNVREKIKNNIGNIAKELGGYSVLIGKYTADEKQAILLSLSDDTIKTLVASVEDKSIFMTDDVSAAVAGKIGSGEGQTPFSKIVGMLDTKNEDGTTKSGYDVLLEAYGPDGMANLLSSVTANSENMTKLIETLDKQTFLTPKVQQAIIDSGVFDQIIDINTLPIDQIIDALGGYEALLECYDTDDLTKIVEAIGTDNITNFIKESGIIESIDVKAKITELFELLKSRTDEMKALLRSIAFRFLTMLNTDIDYIAINGKSIFNGKFDLNAILLALMQGLPDIEDILELGEDATVAGYVLEIGMMKDKYPNTTPYTYGLEIGFIGDPSSLQSFLELYADILTFDISDDFDIDIGVTVPAVVTAIYEKILTSSKTNAVKSKILAIPTTSISDIGDLIAGISDEELATVVDTVADKADEIRAKAYSKVDESSLPADAVSKAKDGIDKIIDNLLTLDKAKQLRDKAVGALNKVPAAIANKTLNDFYREDSRSFAIGNHRVSVDLYEKINKIVKLPADVKIYFNTVISVGVELDVKVNDLYRLTLLNAKGTESVYYLPSGTTFSSLGIGGVMDEDLAPVTKMPAEDIFLYSDGLYSMTFTYNGQIVGKPIIYAKGMWTGENIPEKPAGEPGYTYEWADYTDAINVIKRHTVELIGTEIEGNTLTFVDVNDNRVVKEPVIFELGDDYDTLKAQFIGEILACGPEGIADSDQYYYFVKAPNLVDPEDKHQKIVVVYKYRINFANEYDGQTYTFDFDDLDLFDADACASQFEDGRPANVTKYTLNGKNIKLSDIDGVRPDVYEQNGTVSYSYVLKFVDADNDELIKEIVFSPKANYAIDLDDILVNGHKYAKPHEIEGYTLDKAPVVDNIGADALQTIEVTYQYIYYLNFVDKDGKNPIRAELTNVRFTPGESTFDTVKVEVGGVEMTLDEAILSVDIYKKTYALDPTKAAINAFLASPTKNQYTLSVKVSYTYADQVVFKDQFGKDVITVPYDTHIVTSLDAILTDEVREQLANNRTGDYVLACELTSDYAEYDDYYEPAPTFAGGQVSGHVTVIYYSSLIFKNIEGEILNYVSEETGEPVPTRFIPDSDMTLEYIEGMSDIDFGKNRPDGIEHKTVGATVSTMPSQAVQYVTVRYNYKLVIKDAKHTDVTIDMIGGDFDFEPTAGQSIDTFYSHIEQAIRNNHSGDYTNIIFTDRETLDVKLSDYTKCDVIEIVAFVEYEYEIKFVGVGSNSSAIVFEEFLYSHSEGEHLADIEDEIKMHLLEAYKEEHNGKEAVDVVFLVRDVSPIRQLALIPDNFGEWRVITSAELEEYATHTDVAHEFGVLFVGQITFKDEKGNTLAVVEYYEGVKYIKVLDEVKNAFDESKLDECFDYETITADDLSGLYDTTTGELYIDSYTVVVSAKQVQGRIWIDIGGNKHKVLYNVKDTLESIKQKADATIGTAYLAGEGTRYEIVYKDKDNYVKQGFEDFVEFENNCAKLGNEVTVFLTVSVKKYYLEFVDANGNRVGALIEYEYDDSKDSITVPELPTDAPIGRTVIGWADFDLDRISDDMNNPQRVAVELGYATYYYRFYDKNGDEIVELRREFTLETDSLDLPTNADVPAILGYVGAWDKEIKPYQKGNTGSEEYYAKYTPIKYIATFIADGKEVGKVEFTVEDSVPFATEPKVPEKAGYTGAWESYTAKAEDITVNAVYTLVDPEATDSSDSSGSADSSDRSDLSDGSDSPDDTLGAVTTAVGSGILGVEGESGNFIWWLLWIIIILLVVGIIVVIILLIIKNNKDDEPPTPPTAPTPEPVVPEAEPDTAPEAAPEPEPEAAPEPKPAPTPTIPATAHVLTSTSRGTINLCDLDKYFEAGDTVSLEILQEKKLVSKNEKRLKVLGSGTITKPMTVVADYFSGSAKDKIREVGGTPIEKE